MFVYTLQLFRVSVSWYSSKNVSMIVPSSIRGFHEAGIWTETTSATGLIVPIKSKLSASMITVKVRSRSCSWISVKVRVWRSNNKIWWMFSKDDSKIPSKESVLKEFAIFRWLVIECLHIAFRFPQSDQHWFAIQWSDVPHQTWVRLQSVWIRGIKRNHRGILWFPLFVLSFCWDFFQNINGLEVFVGLIM